MTPRERLESLGLHAMADQYDQIAEAEWLPWLLEQEETERQRRSLERRRKMARLGRSSAATLTPACTSSPAQRATHRR
jgi:hypothetical protein